MWLKNRDLNPPLGKEYVCFYITLSETIRGKRPIYLINNYSAIWPARFLAESQQHHVIHWGRKVAAQSFTVKEIWEIQTALGRRWSPLTEEWEWRRERSVIPGSSGASSAGQLNTTSEPRPPRKDECGGNLFSDCSLSSAGLCGGAFYGCV